MIEWNRSSLKRSCLDWAYQRNGSIWQWKQYARPLTPSSSMENLQVSSLHPVVSVKVTFFPYIFFFCVLKAFHLCCRKPQKLSSYKVFFHVVEGPVYPIFCLLMTPYFFVNLEQGNVKTFYPFWHNMKWLLAKLSIDRKLPYFLAEIPALR